MQVLSRLAAAVALSAAIGCSSDVRAPVSGKVYVGDKLVTSGEVRFHGEKTYVASKIGPDGSYSVTDAPVGVCKVTVHPPSTLEAKAGAPPKGTAAIEGGDAPPPSVIAPELKEKPAAPKVGMPGMPGAPSGVMPIGPVGSPTGIIKGVLVPEKYQTRETTDLTLTVNKGSNSFDVKMGK